MVLIASYMIVSLIATLFFMRKPKHDIQLRVFAYNIISSPIYVACAFIGSTSLIIARIVIGYEKLYHEIVYKDKETKNVK